MLTPNPENPNKPSDVEKSPAPTSLRTLLKHGSEQDLKQALTDDLVRQRLIYCPRINNDLLDDWGIFGHSRGFIYVVGKTHNGTTTVNEDMWQQGKTVKGIGVGRHFMQALPHYDSFPTSMFNHEIIRSGAETDEYNRLLTALGINDEQLAEVELVDCGMLDVYEHLGINPDEVTELRLPQEPEDPADWWKEG